MNLVYPPIFDLMKEENTDQWPKVIIYPANIRFSARSICSELP